MNHSLLAALHQTNAFRVVLLLTLALLVAGCGTAVFSVDVATPTHAGTPLPVPSPSLPPTDTAAALPTTPIEIPTATSLPSPTLAPTAVPSLFPAASPTFASNSTSVATPRTFTQVKVFLIALEDNGKAGSLVGCGDSVVGVERVIAPTTAPLTAGLRELLSIHDRLYGQSGLYNALYQSDLQVSKVTIVNGAATIRLTGQLLLGGECDDPRVAAQLTNTALQFSTVNSVEIFVNDIPLNDVLSGK
jgi:Sporulation and spore germination